MDQRKGLYILSKAQKIHLCISAMLPSVVVGVLSGILTMQQARLLYEQLSKPFLSPAGYVFPFVWSILYIGMGVATYYVFRSNIFPEDKRMAIMVYSAQLLLNFIWPIVFFNLKLYGLAVLVICFLWFLIFINTIIYYRICKKSGYIMAVYLVWVGYALYLNFGIALLNCNMH